MSYRALRQRETCWFAQCEVPGAPVVLGDANDSERVLLCGVHLGAVYHATSHPAATVALVEAPDGLRSVVVAWAA